MSNVKTHQSADGQRRRCTAAKCPLEPGGDHVEMPSEMVARYNELEVAHELGDIADMSRTERAEYAEMQKFVEGSRIDNHSEAMRVINEKRRTLGPNGDPLYPEDLDGQYAQAEILRSAARARQHRIIREESINNHDQAVDSMKTAEVDWTEIIERRESKIRELRADGNTRAAQSAEADLDRVRESANAERTAAEKVAANYDRQLINAAETPEHRIAAEKVVDLRSRLRAADVEKAGLKAREELQGEVFYENQGKALETIYEIEDAQAANKSTRKELKNSLFLAERQLATAARNSIQK